VGRESFNQLMDRELPDVERARIRRIAESHEAVKNVHEPQDPHCGSFHLHPLHWAWTPKMPLADAHVISDAVEAALRQSLSRREVIIHQDPAGLERSRFRTARP